MNQRYDWYKLFNEDRHVFRRSEFTSKDGALHTTILRAAKRHGVAVDVKICHRWVSIEAKRLTSATK